ncbi:MAG: hypothetical protein NTV72_03845 [Candidatus Taylorbacteria bacterium]|nr:hypothetical protein [Candidatus Taylorbacteria bacterium]
MSIDLKQKQNPKPVSLPEDHGPHDNVIEWWYFNGHVTAKDGRRFSFMDCLFKVDIAKVNIPHFSHNPLRNKFMDGKHVYFAHSVVSDLKEQKNYKEIQDISLVSRDSFKKPYLFVNYINPNILHGYVNSVIEEKSPSVFHIKTGNLDLELHSKMKPLLEGGHGYVGTVESGSYYYSLTNLHTKGTLCLNGEKIEVEGKAWMDHQWADATYKKDKWTWFSFQLENGMDIMCVEYDTKIGKDTLVDMLDGDGKQSQYKKLFLTPGKDVWESEKTKAKYPMSWKIEVPEGDITITARSTMSDQEMIFGQINYWEGPLEVLAKIGGTAGGKNGGKDGIKEVKGVGFMELVGYPSDFNYLALVGKDLERSLFKRIFHKKV